MAGSGRDVEWNVVVNMINAALFYSNVPPELHTHDTPLFLETEQLIAAPVIGLRSQINDGQTPINQDTQN